MARLGRMAAEASDVYTGLSSAEAAARKARGEYNINQPSSSRSYLRILLENAFTPINSVLFAISGALVSLGQVGDAAMTAGLVIINVVAGVFQEGRAKRRLDQISLLHRPKVTIVRDGAVQSFDPAEIVLGDLIRLNPGDEVQVDGALLQSQGLSFDESLLTGESDHVPKSAGDRVYSGSFCMTGSGLFVCDRVGGQSLAQQITGRARSFRNTRTPLQREIGITLFVMGAVVIVLGLAVLNSFNAIYDTFPLEETFKAAAVIVALVPQGLSFMVTVTYALAAVRIAATGALIQRLNAVESISHIDTLCLDKTGTLTTNALRLERLTPARPGDLTASQILATFCASASVQTRTTEAIAAAFPSTAQPARAEKQFNSTDKWSGLSFDLAEFRGCYVLGAPEMIALPADEALLKEVPVWLQEGLRVLVFAGSNEPVSSFEAGLPDNLRLLAIVVLRDELRDEALETVAAFRDNGVELKVLSGDNPESVAALARLAGIESRCAAVSGAELDRLDTASLAVTAARTTVFGRITPEHKDRLVAALQDSDRYVAMIGDGVNDVPALKRADVAVAMRSGSAVTRGVADIVLLLDSFSVLPAAFREGQRIRGGMQSIIRLFLVRTISLSLIILATAIFGDLFPTSPRLAGLHAALTVGFPALLLAVWARPARTAQYLLPSAARFVLPIALSIAIVSFATYHGYLALGADQEQARTALLLIGVVCGVVLLPYVDKPIGQLMTLKCEFDSRLVALALAMLAVLLLSFIVAPVRRFYEMILPGPVDLIVFLAALSAWALSLRLYARWYGKQRDEEAS